MGSTLAPAIYCPGVIRDGKRPRLLTGSLGSTTKAFAAGFFSKSKSSPNPDLDASLEFLDLASEYSLLEQVSNLWFPSNDSVLYYRTWLVCISIMRPGTSLALNYPGDLKLFWLSPVVPQVLRVRPTGRDRRCSPTIRKIKPNTSVILIQKKGVWWGCFMCSSW